MFPRDSTPEGKQVVVFLSAKKWQDSARDVEVLSVLTVSCLQIFQPEVLFSHVSVVSA